MQTIIVASTRRYSGKTGVCVALIDELSRRGLDVGYFKPYGGMPTDVDGVMTDRDAAFINGWLRRPSPVTDVCPVVRSRAFIEDLLAGRPIPGPAEVAAAFARVAEGRDVVVVEAPSDLEQGAGAGLSATDIHQALGGRILLVENTTSAEAPDRVLRAAVIFGDSFVGVIHNRVTDPDHKLVETQIVPFLASRGITSFGVLPHDPLLSSVTVREIVDVLGGSVLCGEDHLGDLVESFMVGAMGQEKALRFFRRKARKAVVTGGDRADVQMAALETSTAVLVLTGNMSPSPAVMGRACDLGVPMVLVDTDTLSAIEHLDLLFGHVRLHGPGKAERMRLMFTHAVPVEPLLEALGIASSSDNREL
ncbi:MAG TPA: phosphotransacetylase family protein [Coriobacteriia bacterium]